MAAKGSGVNASRSASLDTGDARDILPMKLGRALWWLRLPRLARPLVQRRTRPQILEEFLNLLRQRLGGGAEVAGGGEHRSRGRAGLADGVAQRADIGDERLVALRGRLRIDGDLA